MTKMSNFHYKGINQWGQKITQDLDAPNLALAKVELHKQGIRILKIVKRRNSFFNKDYKQIRPADIRFFTRQLATMMKAGIPLLQALDIVSKSQSNRNIHQLIHRIKQDIQTGLSLAEALGKHPVYFNELTCNLVHIGEQSGSLDILLDKVTAHQEKVEQIKKKLKKATTYPLAIVLISLIVTLALLLLVVPQFESLFRGFGADLPWITRMVVKISQGVQSSWYVLIGLLSLGFCTYLRIKKNQNSSFSYKMDEFLLKMPIIGPILKKAAIARFASTLAITLSAGLPLAHALHAISAARGLRLYAEVADQIRQDLSSGLSIHVAMQKTNAFPNMVIQMIQIGEESGVLDTMLNTIAVYYEDEVDHAMEVANQLLEPVIMSILGILVGGLVISMYLPIFKLGSII